MHRGDDGDPRPVIVRTALHSSLLDSSSTTMMSGLWFSTASIITLG